MLRLSSGLGSRGRGEQKPCSLNPKPSLEYICQKYKFAQRPNTTVGNEPTSEVKWLRGSSSQSLAGFRAA